MDRKNSLIPDCVVGDGLRTVNSWVLGWINGVVKRTDIRSGDKMLLVAAMMSEYSEIVALVERDLKARENSFYQVNQ